VRCGADLVLELPTPWAANTAEIFARGGVMLLQKTGVVTDLAFGSECGDAADLQQLAAALDSSEYEENLRALLGSGESFAVCRQKAAARIVGAETAALLSRPNNNLGVEYCRAIRRLGGNMDVMTVLRRGAGHDGTPAEGIASASYIRALLAQGQEEEALAYMSPAAADVLRREIAAGRAPAGLHNCERAVLAKLRTMGEEDFAPYDTSGEGLYHRLYQAVRSGHTVEGILDTAKTKRYSHARLRRMVLSAWLDMAQVPQDIPYLRVLAANDTGRRLLRQMRDNGASVLTKAADVSAIGGAAEELFAAEAARTDLYTLAFPNLAAGGCGRDWRITPVMR
jgi:predicted nucleotidyltransferase